MSDTITVIALEQGFYDGARRRRHSTFDVPFGVSAPWFAPLESRRGEETIQSADAEAAEAARGPDVDTLSAMSRQGGRGPLDKSKGGK